MPCSPLLKGVSDPLRVLQVIRDNPVLCYSEPPQTFYPLQEQGWVSYEGGRWHLTEEGTKAAGPRPQKKRKPTGAFMGGLFKIKQSTEEEL